MFDGNDIVPEEQLKKTVAPFEKTEIQEKALRHTDTDAEDPFHTLIFGCNLTAECKRGPNWIRKMEKSIIDEQGIHSED